MDLLKQYYEANTDERIDALPLADDFRFEGPIMQIDGAAEFKAQLKQMQPMIKSMEMEQQFSSGDEHCALYTFHANMPIKPVRMAEWFTLRGNKISRIRLVFDATEMRVAMGAAAEA